ncbi:MAG: PepSY-like domain-containing protein [Chitinophagales bacterium]
MKRIVLLPLALFSCMHVFAQKTSVDNVPAPVVEKFKTAYPTAEKVQWELDEEEFFAGFILNKKEKSAHYAADGKWLRTETPVRILDMPKTVKQCAFKNFKNYSIMDPVKVETGDKGIYYKMELTKDDLTYYAEISEVGELTKHYEKEDPNKKPEEKKE